LIPEPLELFRAGHRESVARFNEHDFEGAFGALSEEVEYRPASFWVVLGLPEVVIGRDAVVRVFREFIEQFPDYKMVLERADHVSERVFLTRMASRGTGRASGAKVEYHWSQVIEIGDDLLVSRMREYADHDEALRVAQTGT
jgi:ketosteroid isomerase-like protein